MAAATNPLAPTMGKRRRPYAVQEAIARIIHGDAFAEYDLCPTARLVLSRIAARCRPTNGDARCYESKRKIATNLGCSERTVIRWANHLVRLGLVEHAGQARSCANGKFLNGHLRLTRLACAELGLAYVGGESTSDERALHGVTLIPEEARRATVQRAVAARRQPAPDTTPAPCPEAPPAPCPEAPPAPVPADNCRVPEVAPGHEVSLSLRSRTSGKSSSCGKQSRGRAGANGCREGFVRRGRFILPQDLVGIADAGMGPAAVASLMRIAREGGKRLSDIVAYAQHHLRGKQPDHQFAYLRRLAGENTDFAFLVRQQREQAAAASAAAIERKRLDAVAFFHRGNDYRASDGSRLRLTPSGRHIEHRSADGRTVLGSRPVDDDFLRAIRDDRLEPWPNNPTPEPPRFIPAQPRRAESKPGPVPLRELLSRVQVGLAPPSTSLRSA